LKAKTQLVYSSALPLPLHCSDPVLLQQLLARREVLAGLVEFQVVLHTPGKFPAGTLGPAMMMWHQLPRQQRQQLKQQQQQQQQQRQVDAGSGIQQDLQRQQQQQQVSRREARQQQLQQQHRVLWLWCHASYFKQVHEAIQLSISSSRSADQQQGVDLTAAAGSSEAVTKVVTLTGVTVQSLSSSLRRVELLGPSADQVLQAALQQQQQQQGLAAAAAADTVAPSRHTTSSSSSRVAPHNEVWAALAAAPLSAWQGLRQGCVLGLAALDPRLAKPLRHSGVFEAPGWLPRDPTAAAAGDMSAAAAAAAGKELQRLLGNWPHNGEYAIVS
jgi:hypothetical protein